MLDEAVTVINRNPTHRVEVTGPACSLGTPQHNMDLGAHRAAAVRAHLLNRGVAAQRVSAVTHGKDSPAFPNDSEQHRKLNRRVAITVKP